MWKRLVLLAVAVACTFFLPACSGCGHSAEDDGDNASESPTPESTPQPTLPPDEDQDHDGFGSDEDCDDSDPAIHPGAEEVCDDIDHDCNGDAYAGTDYLTFFEDEDGDGYGSPMLTRYSCDTSIEGYALEGGDCNDEDPAINPAAQEVCNDIDDDCDLQIDEGLNPVFYYYDQDGDGYGDPEESVSSCDGSLDGYVDSGDDCDDGSSLVHPGAVEVCDAYDWDCDGSPDNGLEYVTYYLDEDSDGYGSSASMIDTCDGAPFGYAASSDDCDDGAYDVNPGQAELCDDIDHDCDGQVDNGLEYLSYYPDADEDGYGDSSSALSSCGEAPEGYVEDGDDCDDQNYDVNPSAYEYCNGLDDDCDGSVDDDAVDGYDYALDEDEDGLGAVDSMAWRCAGVLNEWDCDDSDPLEPQVVNAAAEGSSQDGSYDFPWLSVQAGIDAAESCVIVMEGTYYESIDFKGKALSVMGVGGADSTLINGFESGDAVATFSSGEGADSELRGFTLVAGEGHLESASVSGDCSDGESCLDYTLDYCGGGIYVDGATPTLSALKVASNLLPEGGSWAEGNDAYSSSSSGGGLCLRNSSLTIEDVDFWYNYADRGGAVYVDAFSSLELRHSFVVGNVSLRGAGFFVDRGELALTNVTSSWNEAYYGGGATYVSDGTLRESNVTHGKDLSEEGGVVELAGGSSAVMTNSIVYGASMGAGIHVAAEASFAGKYNNVYGNAGGEYAGLAALTGTDGNISGDPLFTDVSDDNVAENDDWTLGSESPSIDAGNPALNFNDADGSRNDQGAFGGPGSSWD